MARPSIFLFGLALLVPLAGCESASRPAREGQSFPFEFTVTAVTGEQISLADFRGKVVITDLWGTWCPPCRLEIPSFIKLQETYGAQGFQMIGLNFENGDAQAASRKVVDFIAETGINYPCALGTKQIQDQVPNLQGFPTTIFIDKTGKVRQMLVGYHQYEDLEAIVKQLLAE